MDKKIIIIMVIIIVAVIVALFLNFNISKEDTKIKMISKSSINEDSSIKIKLTDLNNMSIDNQTINIKIINKKGKIDEYSVKTNKKGVAKLKLNKIKPGKYSVNFTYYGNDNYTGSNTTQKITIKEKAVEVQETSSNEYTESSYNQENSYNDYSVSSYSKDSLNYDSKYNIYYDDDGIVVDPTGNNYMGEAGKSYQEVREQYDWIDKHGLY